MKLEILQKEDLQPVMAELQQLKVMVQKILETKNGPTDDLSLAREKGLLSITRAAKLAGVSQNTLRKAIDNGLINAAPLIPGGHPRISKTELERFIREHGRARIKAAKVPRAIQNMLNQ